MATGFSDPPYTEWLESPVPDRNMSLLREFWFEDRAGRRWVSAAGSVINGASIPRALWTLLGSPYTGSYRRASVVHDVACVQAQGDDERRAADRMFYEACRVGGCSIDEATILYTGVRIGAGWSRYVGQSAESRPRIERRAEDRRIEADFQIVATKVLQEPSSDDPFEVERRVDQALIDLNRLPPHAD